MLNYLKKIDVASQLEGNRGYDERKCVDKHEENEGFDKAINVSNNVIMEVFIFDITW